MKKVLVCISVLLLTACNSTTQNNDTVALVNAKETKVISYHKTDKQCQSAKITQDIRSKAEWARNSVAKRSSHSSDFKLAQCAG